MIYIFPPFPLLLLLLLTLGEEDWRVSKASKDPYHNSL